MPRQEPQLTGKRGSITCKDVDRHVAPGLEEGAQRGIDHWKPLTTPSTNVGDDLEKCPVNAHHLLNTTTVLDPYLTRLIQANGPLRRTALKLSGAQGAEKLASRRLRSKVYEHVCQFSPELPIDLIE